METRRTKRQLAFTCCGLLALLAVVGCSGTDSYPPPKISTPDSGSPEDAKPTPLLHFDDPRHSTGSLCPEDGSLTYASFAREFFATYCVRCHGSDKFGIAARHGAPQDHNFDTLEGVQQWIPAIDMMAAGGPKVVHSDMPLNDPKPTEDERRALGAWLACREGLQL